MTFTDISEYIGHKVNKVCRDANKNTLAEAVNKLSISASPSPEKSKQKSSNATGSLTANAGEQSQEDGERSASPSEKRVEVQFLEPLVAQRGDSGPSASNKHDGKCSNCYLLYNVYM